MANTSSAKKADRVSIRKKKINTRVTDEFKQARKAVKDSLTKGDIKAAKSALPKAYSEIDTAVKKGVIKKQTGARYKSRLAGSIKKLDTKA